MLSLLSCFSQNWWVWSWIRFCADASRCRGPWRQIDSAALTGETCFSLHRRRLSRSSWFVTAKRTKHDKLSAVELKCLKSEDVTNTSYAFTEKSCFTEDYVSSSREKEYRRVDFLFCSQNLVCGLAVRTPRSMSHPAFQL